MIKADYHRDLWKEISQKLLDLFQKAADDAFNCGLISDSLREEFFMSGKYDYSN